MKEIEYNTQTKKLLLPEYGRNIQKMIDHCATLPTKQERTNCAYAIVNLMGNMFPHLRDINDFKHKLWDHLAVMSNFELDIDYPYETAKKEDLNARPAKVDYPQNNIKYRHYGSNLERMIAKATEYPEGEERTYLIALLANHMKRGFITWNKDSVEDKKIFDDLKEYSKGAICLDESFVKLSEPKEYFYHRKKNNNGR